jgi:hypothetical protein
MIFKIRERKAATAKEKETGNNERNPAAIKKKAEH